MLPDLDVKWRIRKNHHKSERSTCRENGWLKPPSVKNCIERIWDKRSCSFWNIETVSSLTLVKHFKSVRINWFLFHIVRAFSVFVINVLMLKKRIIFLNTTYLPVLSKCATLFQPHTQRAFSLSLQPSYWHINTWMTATEVFGKSFSEKTLFSIPFLLTKISFWVKLDKSIKNGIPFVMTVPGVHHGAFNTRYSIAIATKHASSSWPEYGRVSGKSKESQRPGMQFRLLIKGIIWVKANVISEVWRKKICCPTERLRLNSLDG